MSDPTEPEPVDAEFEPADDAPSSDAPRRKGGLAGYVIVFLLALLIGGAGGIWLYWQYGPREAASVDVSALEARLAELESADTPQPFDPSALEARLAELETAPQSDAESVDLSGIEARLEALETSGGETTPSDPTVPVRVIALEAAVNDNEALINQALDQIGEMEGGTDPAVLTALETRIAALEAAAGTGEPVDLPAIEARLDALEAATPPEPFDPAALEARLSALEAAETPEPDLSAIEARLAALETRLEQGDANAAGANRDSRQLAARSLALVALVEAARTGEPFEAERAALDRLWRHQADIASLAGYARSGVPDSDALAESYPRTAIENAIGTNRVFFGLIEVRPSSGGQTSPLARIALAAERLDAGDLAGAVTLTEQLDGDALEAAQSWLLQARARLAVNGALDALRSELVAQAAEAGADPT
jgi:hypothetical protein